MLVLLQLDATNPGVLDGLLAEGRAPRLEALRRVGREHELDSPATHLEGAVAATLHTGLEPCEHGVYYPFQWSPDEQRVRFRAEAGPGEPVWQRLAKAGLRSLVIDPYDARPTDSFSGVCLSGWQFRNRVALPVWSRPRGAYRRIARRLGDAPPAEEVFGNPSPRELRRLRRSLLDAPGRVARATAELLRGERFDLVWVNFASAHLAGHQFWRTEELAAGDGELDTALTDVYAAVDAALGAIVDLLPDDADLIVFSPLGMAPETGRADMLPAMLDAVLSGGAGADGGTVAGEALWRLRARIPTPLRAGVARAMPDRLALDLTARLALSGTDWTRTTAFPLPSDHHGYVRLNLRGREREGIVDPGRADELLGRIAAGLRTFTDADGRPAVAGMARGEDAFGPGAQSHLLPDLIVRWSGDAAAGADRVASPAFGEVSRRSAGTGRSGNHTDEAWCLVAPGPSRHRRPSRRARVVDLAATACAVLGADASGLAGEPLLEG